MGARRIVGTDVAALETAATLARRLRHEVLVLPEPIGLAKNRLVNAMGHFDTGNEDRNFRVTAIVETQAFALGSRKHPAGNGDTLFGSMSRNRTGRFRSLL